MENKECNLGKVVYLIDCNQIKKEVIVGVRTTTLLNRGADCKTHKYIKEKEYLLEMESTIDMLNWRSSDSIFLKKEDIIKGL